MEKILKISKIIRLSLSMIIAVIIVSIFLLLILYSGMTTSENGELLCFSTQVYSSDLLENQNNFFIEIMHTKIPFQIINDFWIKTVLFFVFLYLGAISCFIYYHLKSLFSLYEKGQIFTLQNTKHIKFIAWGILISAFFRFCMTLLIWFVVNRLIETPLSLGLALPINYILTGVIAYSISLVMEEAQKLKEENEMVI